MRYLLALTLAGACMAQQPRVTNAKLETQALSGGLEARIKALAAANRDGAWVGYAQPIVAGEHNSCCYHSNDGWSWRGCWLEGRVTTPGVPASAAGPVMLEGPRHITILFRVSQGSVEKVRTFSSDCDLEAGGLPFLWLTAVPASESLSYLGSFVTTASDQRKLSETALSAIALHGDAAAGTMLEKYAAVGNPEYLREKAIFWLGNSRGQRGFEVVRKIAREDSSEKMREKAIFALNVSKQPQATESIIDIAKNDRSPHVRGQALFWLAQKAGNQAAGTITSAIENDPDTQVKEKAVFALSQLPKEQGVPLLIEQARSNKNPAIRKKAMFWLGQSKDARALAFFEQVLK